MVEKQEKNLQDLEKNELDSPETDKKKDDNQDNNEQENKEDEADIKEDQSGLEKLKEELQTKEQRIMELENLIEGLKDRHLRLQADFDNYRKRVTREKEEIYTTALGDLIKQLLPIIDNFERALDSFKSANLDPKYYDGLEMIYKEFIGILNKNGLEEIEALNCNFDPNLHHAVMKVEAEGDEENIIKEVFQKGYMLNNKVIRPSMVKVAVKN
ncbi:MAG TPA: nucleotide exchange factor GrpE [Clostridiales bacterium]|nr:nucleotide exchange factor GrpE [Clostridiales bacterium]